MYVRSKTLKGQNGVEFSFQSTVKQHVSLSHQICKVLGLFAQFKKKLFTKKKKPKSYYGGPGPLLGGGGAEGMEGSKSDLICSKKVILYDQGESNTPFFNI